MKCENFYIEMVTGRRSLSCAAIHVSIIMYVSYGGISLPSLKLYHLNYVDLSDLYVDLSVIYVDFSDHYFDLSEKYHHN